MKSTITEIKELQDKLSEKSETLALYMKDEFDVELSISGCLSIINTDLYSCSIWFFERANDIKESGCDKMPDNESELLEMFRSREIQKENIAKAVEFFLETSKNKDVV